MKLSITDKFLWEMYHFLESISGVTNFLLSSRWQQAEMLRIDKNPVIKKYQKERGRANFSKFVYYLKKNNYIKVHNLKTNQAFVFTKEGLSKALKASFFMEGKRKRKDGKWVMLMFDMPRSHRVARGLLKSIIVNLGYKLFQHSVWITPYDVSEKTENLIQFHSLDKYVKIFLIEEI